MAALVVVVVRTTKGSLGADILGWHWLLAAGLDVIDGTAVVQIAGEYSELVDDDQDERVGIDVAGDATEWMIIDVRVNGSTRGTEIRFPTPAQPARCGNCNQCRGSSGWAAPRILRG